MSVIKELGECAVVGCDRPRKGKYCWAHHKRNSRAGLKGTKIKDEPIEEQMKPFERLIAVCIDVADCDSEDDVKWERVLDLLRATCRGWMRSNGWSPAAKGITLIPSIAEVPIVVSLEAQPPSAAA